MKKHGAQRLGTFVVASLVCLGCVLFATAQANLKDKDLAQALEFAKQNRQVDALPLLDRVGPRYLNDADIQAYWGIAIVANSATIKDVTVRKKEVRRGAEVLNRAKALGTKNVIALHYQEILEISDDVDSVSKTANKAIEDLIRDGEAYFGKGEYDKAFLAYEKAFKLDPKSYEAALYAGDCLYSQKRYKESELWFAKAVAIDRDREAAFRYWGDALAEQGNGQAALEKFAYAYIAEPDSRIVFDRLIRAIQEFGARRSSPFVVIPSKTDEEEMVIDQALLKSEDGTTAWNQFTEVRKQQIMRAGGKKYISTVADDVECLRAVVASAKELLRRDKSIRLNKSLENLIRLDAIGMVDIYTMLFLHGGNGDFYPSYREANRPRMLRFLIDYFANDVQENIKSLG